MSGTNWRLTAVAAVAAVGMSFTATTAANAANADMSGHWHVPAGLVTSMFSQEMGLGYNEGSACTDCHNDEQADGGVNFTTCEGIAAVDKGVMKRNLRDNRMPYGVDPATPANLPAHERLKTWIEAGAKNDDLWQAVKADFNDMDAWGEGGQGACTTCHMSFEEPPSFHEMDLTSYEGVMTGADSGGDPATGVKTVIPGKPGESKMYLRVTENRMPPGVFASEDNRDTYQINAVLAWYDQGASCK